MRDFTVQRKDIRRVFSKARVFAVSGRIDASSPAFEDAVRRLSGAGVETVLFDRPEEVEEGGAVVLALSRRDAEAAGGSGFLAAPASAPLDVKMFCSYVSTLDGEAAALEMADLIMTAKGA